MVSVKPILVVPNTILREKSRDVVIDKKITEFTESLAQTLFAKDNPKGVGLSAPQIGKNWNLFATWLAKDLEEDPTKDDLEIFLNPVITNASKELTYGPDPEEPILEGCLSIPGLYGPVPRHFWIEVEYMTLHSEKKQTKRFESFEARVLQHEYDHLQGILFTDYSLKHDLPVYEFIGKKMKEIDKEIIKAF